MSDQRFEINNLREAASYFHNLFYEKKGINLSNAGLIKPRLENLAPKYYEKDHDVDDRDNDYRMLIQKQFERKDYVSPIAFILKEQQHSNALGIPDNHYYIVIFRRKWLNRWADTFDNRKYGGQGGIYLPTRILDYVRNNDMREQSDLILVLGDGTVYKAGCKEVSLFFKKFGHAYVNQYGQICTGLAKEVFKLE